MTRIICWLLGHKWFTCGGNGIFFQRGMELFNYKYCTRCSKITKFDVHKAEEPAFPVNPNQNIDWICWYADHEI